MKAFSGRKLFRTKKGKLCKGGIFMRKSKSTSKLNSELLILTNLRALVLCALLIAMSVTLALIGKRFFTFGFIRITFENLPILFSALTFGPLAGALTAVAADLVSCLITGMAVNPIITLGALSIGFISGFVSKYLIKKPGRFRIIASCGAAHIIGSMLIKSIGLMVIYANPLLLLWRIPLYAAIGTAEILCLITLLKNKEIKSLIERVKGL